MKKIITIVGTSLFTNLKLENDSDFKNLKETKSASDWDKTTVLKENREDLTRKAKAENGWKNKNNLKLSSEIKSIVSIAQELRQNKADEVIEIYFLSTDTVVSRLGAELLSEWFLFYQSDLVNSVIFIPDTHVIEGLQLDNQSAFIKKGFSNLLRAIRTIVKNGNKSGETILNITSGYKAIVPFLTILGQLDTLPLKYIYEEANLESQLPLISLEPFPIHFDTGIAELYLFYLDSNVLRNTDFVQSNFKKVFSKLLGWKLIEEHPKISGTYRVSPLGIFFQEYTNIHYEGGKNILGSLMEYKLFEYFSQPKNQYEGYSSVQRGRKIGNSKRDIDLFFQHDKNQDWVIFGECKSLSEARNTDKILDNLQKRQQVANDEEKWQLKEYQLFVHKANFQDKELLDETFNKCSEFAKGKFEFKIFYINIPVSEREFRYHTFISDKLSKIENHV
jgi:putative CRISPR-associated protein (TIGR02619 family)